MSWGYTSSHSVFSQQLGYVIDAVPGLGRVYDHAYFPVSRCLETRGWGAEGGGELERTTLL